MKISFNHFLRTLSISYLLFIFIFKISAKEEVLHSSTDFIFQDEKIYISTDKPYYSAGEDIWCKGFSVNETTLVPNCRSQFIYIELSNQFDSVCNRIKLKKDSTGFSGHIKLSAQLQEGYYELRAFTKWMLNFSDDFIFRKTVYIGNDINKKISCKTHSKL